MISGLKKHIINPANTQRNEHMIITSKRRFNDNNYMFVTFDVCREPPITRPLLSCNKW